MRSRPLIFVTELLLLMVGLFACSSHRDRDEDVRREMEAIERKIVPLDAQVLARSGPVHSDWSSKATWDIETKVDGAEYSKWVTSQLAPEFKIVRADESQLTFTKHSGGDTRSIECKLALTNAKLRILATFTVSPD